jgi:hypothetical protein
MNIFGAQKKAKYSILRNIDADIQTITFDEPTTNPLSCQGIKFCDKIYCLVYFEKSATNLTYIFEKNVMLKFYFRNKETIIHIVNPKYKINEIKIWDEKYANNYSALTWNIQCKEIDYINIMSYENSKN